MAAIGKPPLETKTVRRIWKTPGSKFNWLFLASSLVMLGIVLWLYRSALATQQYPGPYYDPLRAFGIVSSLLVLLVTAYTLRRRFVRRLPGKMQDWLWMHIWFGILSILVACIHANFQNITTGFSFLRERFTEAAFGTTALYALLLLVLSGIVGRLLDIWQARTIASEADTNGAGIMRSVEERLLDLSLTLERLSAGKSPQFKHYCTLELAGSEAPLQVLSTLPPSETADFRHAHAVLSETMRLTRSLQRQQRAELIIRLWRYVHIPLAIASFAVIAYHSLAELWIMLVLHQ